MQIDRQIPSDTLKDEARAWEQLVAPKLNLPLNVLEICRHGFTEMLNNVIDHADSKIVSIHCNNNGHTTALEIEDDGIGVFSSLRAHFGFDSDLHALMELTKGKLTVAPLAHSGEGIFFSSKMFDCFTLESGSLSAKFSSNQCIVHPLKENRKGTRIVMQIANDCSRKIQEVFARFTNPNDFSFCKTRFLLALAAMEGDLTSRSQAKRAVVRFEQFNEVEVDFAGVEHVGQAFVDELLRVWPLAHPSTQITVANASARVSAMIQHVRGRSDLPQAPNVAV